MVGFRARRLVVSVMVVLGRIARVVDKQRVEEAGTRASEDFGCSRGAGCCSTRVPARWLLLFGRMGAFLWVLRQWGRRRAVLGFGWWVVDRVSVVAFGICGA